MDMNSSDTDWAGFPRRPPGEADLPSPGTGRWVVRRKAVVVAAVRNGALSLEDACRRYHLSVEEFLAWQRDLDAHGVPGLRVTRLQIYRDTEPHRGRRAEPAPQLLGEGDG
jgi:hypothetical protein